MNIKRVIYTSGAALAMLGSTFVTAGVINADTTPVGTQQTTSKKADQKKANQQTANKDKQNGDSGSAKVDKNSQAGSTANKNNNANKANDGQAASATKFDNRAPRFTGSQYKDENAGFKQSVTANKDNSTLEYSVKTYESDGTPSSKPFQIKIYKNGSLYKTINTNSGSANGTLTVDRGTYSLKVFTSESTHFTGGLDLQ